MRLDPGLFGLAQAGIGCLDKAMPISTTMQPLAILLHVRASRLLAIALPFLSPHILLPLHTCPIAFLLNH